LSLEEQLAIRPAVNVKIQIISQLIFHDCWIKFYLFSYTKMG
jgi:hypothetical protein